MTYYSTITFILLLWPFIRVTIGQKANALASQAELDTIQILSNKLQIVELGSRSKLYLRSLRDLDLELVAIIAMYPSTHPPWNFSEQNNIENWCKGKYKEVLEEGRGPRVPRSKGSKVKGSQGPRYLKLTFKYELDSKEGPSCLVYKGYCRVCEF